MGLIELIIVVVLLLWLFGYFGRARLGGIGSGNLIHTLLVIALILIVLRLLKVL